MCSAAFVVERPPTVRLLAIVLWSIRLRERVPYDPATRFWNDTDRLLLSPGSLITGPWSVHSERPPCLESRLPAVSLSFTASKDRGPGIGAGLPFTADRRQRFWSVHSGMQRVSPKCHALQTGVASLPDRSRPARRIAGVISTSPLGFDSLRRS